MFSTVVEIVEILQEFVFGFRARLLVFAGFVVLYLWCDTSDSTVRVYRHFSLDTATKSAYLLGSVTNVSLFRLEFVSY